MWVVGVTLLLSADGLGDENKSKVIDIGSRKQLFVDALMIAESSGVRQVMHTPHHTGERLIWADTPWERANRGLFWNQNTVRKEGDKIRLWYQLITLKDDPKLKGPHAATQSMAYAESTDGLRFIKPKLGLCEMFGTREHNILIPASRGGTVWIDPKAPPTHRYRSQTKGAKGHLHFFHSADGLRWHETHSVNIGHCDTQNIAFWDQRVGRYALYSRVWVRFPGKEGNYRYHRRLESDDLVHWDDQGPVIRADKVDLAKYDAATKQPPVDYYGACVFRYPDEHGVYLALAEAFWHWYERPDKKRLGPNRMDARLFVSRDGKRFERVGGRRAFLRNGPEGSFTSRMVWACPSPIPMGDELWIYYMGSNMDHAGYVDQAAKGEIRTGLSRAILRLDGFVSARAEYSGGKLTTPVVRFQGDALRLNIDTSAGGAAWVELLDQAGKPIPEFSRADALPICGNSVRLPVRWKGDADLGKLAGKPVRLRFHLRDCDLYAFQFVKDDG